MTTVDVPAFYFTFGSGQPHFGRYVKIQADSAEEARTQMERSFGTRWSMQYTEAQWNEGGTTQAERWDLEELR